MLPCWKTLLQFSFSGLCRILSSVASVYLILSFVSSSLVAQAGFSSPAGVPVTSKRENDTSQKSTARIISGQIETLATPEQIRPVYSAAAIDPVRRPALDPLAVASRVEVANRQNQRRQLKQNVVSVSYNFSDDSNQSIQGSSPPGNTRVFGSPGRTPNSVETEFVSPGNWIQSAEAHGLVQRSVAQAGYSDRPFIPDSDQSPEQQRSVLQRPQEQSPNRTVGRSRFLPPRLIPPGERPTESGAVDNLRMSTGRTGYPRTASLISPKNYEQLKSFPTLPARYRGLQDTAPFGEQPVNEIPQDNRKPFGDAPAAGRVDPFADPPQTDLPPGDDGQLPSARQRRDPFADPQANQITQQRAPQNQEPQDPQLPGDYPQVDPNQQDLPLPDPDKPPAAAGTRRSSGPIQRPPTKLYGESRFRGDGHLQGYEVSGYDYGQQQNMPVPAYPQESNPPPAYLSPAIQPDSAGSLYEGIAAYDEDCDACDDGYLTETYTSEVYGCCEPLFYLSVFGGWADLDWKGTAVERNATNPTTGVYETGSGYGLGVALGQTQGANLRTEIEFAYRSNSGDALRLNDIPDIENLGGNVNTYSGMLNFVWDFNNTEWLPRVRPYIGLGVGFAFANPDLTFDTGLDLHSPELNNDSSFAYQWIVGTTFQYSTSANLFVEYRYFNMDSVRLESNPDPSNVLLGDFELEANNVFAGFRFRF